MDASHPLSDQTPALLTEGYAWLPNRMRRAPGPVLRTRLLGRTAVALRGPEAVRFFYDEEHVHRHRAVPGPVLSTLFGHGAVHTLDGAEHLARKELFLPLLEPRTVAALSERVGEAWDEAVPEWTKRPRITLFDEASRVLTRGVHRWAGVPLDDAEADATARDMIAMVDGFATPGPRHWRARRARARQERRLSSLVREVRAGTRTAPPGSVLERVAQHRGATGELLDLHTAAVELLNVLRPTIALSWFLAFAAHAQHRWPEHRERLRAGGGFAGGPADEAGGADFATAFAHEVRRFYPFVPFLGGLAAKDMSWHGEDIPAGGLILLDVYGQHHDTRLWDDPYAFRPERFLGRTPERDELIPQGGGLPETGHRCPGENIAVGLLETLATRLALLDCHVPEQNLSIPLHRVPTGPRSGVLLTVGGAAA
ncbi:cytochrome P450 [Streptomyces sp. ODS28]|uniref:cytochrome P450 n=1 Tax=Streptomyces sp. ODS28 TaxID=3136688 RepID=UPI0031EE2703